MATVHCGDALEVLRTLECESVDLCVTSPPYYRKKRYVDPSSNEAALELGQEDCFAEFVVSLLDVFDEVRRVLKPTGLACVNLDDTYAGSGGPGGDYRPGKRFGGQFKSSSPAAGKANGPYKSLMLIPQRFAIGCFGRGWIVRNYGVWDKGGKFEDGVRDRMHHAWEPFIVLAKQGRGHYGEFGKQTDVIRARPGSKRGHIAAYPEDFVEPLIAGGCPPGGVVLDPFCGSGTTLAVAERLGREAIGIDLDPASVEMARRRLLELEQAG